MNDRRAFVRAAVEGIVDEAAAKALLRQAGAELATVYGKKGKGHLRNRVNGYNHAAHHGPWLVLVDLDRDFKCAPPLLQTWLPAPAPHMCFRVAVKEIEAWLLADQDGICGALSIPKSALPAYPDNEIDPKRTMVSLAARSRQRAIREDMVPRPGSGRTVGPAYASRLIEFIERRWRPEAARRHSESLDRSIRAIRTLLTQL